MNQNPETEAVFTAALLSTPLLVPIIISNGEYSALNDQNNNFYVPLFTDEAEVTLWRNSVSSDEPLQIAETSFQEVSARLQKSPFAGVVLNPFSLNFVLSAATALEICGIQMPAPEGTQVFIGEAADFPQHLADALTAKLKQMPTVASAYLLLMYQNEQFSHLLIINSSQPNVDIPLIAAAGQVALTENECLDAVDLNTADWAETAREHAPFYSR